jgi:Uncharacterized alpha/beta hydrolase domain (DUF2235)
VQLNVDGPTIECLAVFDTVGARGIPIQWFKRENRDLYEFHDVELSPVSKTNLQALAIDEHREAFPAAVWRRPEPQLASNVTEQVWFPGCHADVGGGYIDETKRSQKHPKSLDDISPAWMINRLKHHYPDFPIDIQADWKVVDNSWATATQHESRRNIYRLFPFAWRSLCNRYNPGSFWSRLRRWTFVSQDRHASVINEHIHISALERWGRLVRVNWGFRFYKPRNLRLVAEDIRATYSGRVPLTSKQIRVVGWSSHVLDPSNPAARVEVMLHAGRIPPY